MTDMELVERLAAHRTLRSAPREQLEWLASHGTLHRLDAGEVIGAKDVAIYALFVVLSGHLVIRMDRGSGARKAMEWWGGDVTGLLPYSRLTAPPGTTTAEEPTEVLMLDRECFPEMIRQYHELTAILVHVMLDRARRFTTADLQDEKMISLGRLSAGLAHELNNPASAVARSAKELTARLFEIEATALALGAVQLSQDQLQAIARVRAQCGDPSATAERGPMERADREDAFDDWLMNHHLDPELAEALAASSCTLEALESLAKVLGPEALGFALHSIAAGQRARRLTLEVQTAADRVHALVAAIKGFTYMDQSRVPRPVAIGQGLADTLTVLGGKARAKSVSVTVDVAAGLPPVEGYGGELNQVWANLIDNAIDAAPPSGHVEVSAAAENGSVIVRVQDDGPGVPEAIRDRIFEPFFTTKPQGQGTGLGLDIVRRLIQQHNGQIDLETRPGCTVFRVTLPAT